MASISSLGIGSGLDLSSIVDGLTAAERVPTENRLDFKEEAATTKLSAFGLLRSSLSSFQGSLSGLNSTSTYDSKSIATSDSSVFSTSITNNADAGSYSVEVLTLAERQSLATNAATAFSSVDDTIGTGTLSIKFGTTTTVPYSFTQDTEKATQNITVSAENNNTTLSGMRDYINDNDFGVQASIVNDGTGYRLTLTSDNTGASNSMEITVSGDGDGNNNDNTGLSQLAFNASAQSSVTQTVAAQDATLKINGLNITRDTNTVTGAIDGVTLNLLNADVGNTVKVNVTENTNKVKESIQGFVESYNGVVETANALSSYNAETESAGILIGDFTLRSITGQLRSMLSNVVPGLSGNIRALSDIGITTSIDGTLELDATKLDTALASYPDEIQALFTEQGMPTDPDISFTTATDGTEVGNYAVNISTLATQGVFNGATINSLIIDANNDNFTISVNGVSSAEVILTQSTYADGDALAAHIQAQINDDDNLKAAGSTVTVTFDSINNEFDITSEKYGSASKIEFTAVDTNTVNDFGFSVASGIDGLDVAGTINGLSASGNGQILTSDGGDSKGLAVLISLGATGDRGEVSFSRGVANMLDSLISGFLQTDGLLDSREGGLNTKLEEIADDRVKLDLKIESLEARLIQQFSALDSLISDFNSISSFLTQQLDNFVKPNSVGNN